MSGIFENELSSKTRLTPTDFLRLVGTDDVSYKQLVSDVAQCIVEMYTGSTLNGSQKSVKNAIDGIGEIIGDGDLDTTATDLTEAVNEHEGDIGTLISAIGSTSMGTTADTLTGAIAEHEGDIGTLISAIGNTSMGTTADTLTGAIAEHEGDITDLYSKTYQRFVGLINPNTDIPLTQDEKNANLLIVEFNRYGFSRIAIFNPRLNYISSDPAIPSYGQSSLKVVANANPVTSIKFTDNTNAHNVYISRFLI